MSRRQSAGLIGVDLGSRYVKIAQVQRSGGSVSLMLECEAVPDSVGQDWQSHWRDAVPVIRRLLRSGGFRGRQAVGLLPGPLPEYRSVRLAPMPARDLVAAVHWQMGNHVDAAPDALRTQHFDAGEVFENEEPRREIVAMAAPITAVKHYLQLLEACDLTTVAVDAPPSALARAFAAIAPAEEAPPLTLVNLGYGATTVTIASRERIRFVRRFPIGLRDIGIRLAEKLKVPLGEAEKLRESPAAASEDALETPPDLAAASQQVGKKLSREILKCLSYYSVTFRENRPGQGIVAGGGGGDRSLVRMLAQETGIELRCADELPGIDWLESARSERRPVELCLGAMAAGLSIYPEANQNQRNAA